MKLTQMMINGHEWYRIGLVRAVLIVVALVSMVLGSSADTVWGPH